MKDLIFLAITTLITVIIWQGIGVKSINEHALAQGADKVSKVLLKVGISLGINEDKLQNTFRSLTADTLLKGAELEVVFYPGTHTQVISFDME